MKLTNKYGYPETIIKAIENDPYDKGDSEFSATGLIQPPRLRVLAERHKDEIVEDVDDGIYRLLGQLGHALVERAGSGLNNLIETRFFGVVSDTRISAQIDSLSLESDGTLIDWKFTTIYGFKAGVAPKREWVAQMNIQKYLIPDSYKIKQMRIWGILRDWRPKERAASERVGTSEERKWDKLHAGYPKKLGFHDIPMYTKEATKRFIEKRILMHKAAEKELPECDSEDTWNWGRCNGGYCSVSQFCKQFKDHKGDASGQST